MTPGAPRVYVACLASYNAGTLHGKWIDAASIDALQEGIRDVLRTSHEVGAEEWAIHDYDGFGQLSTSLGEYPNVSHVATLGEVLCGLDEGQRGAFEAWYADDPESRTKKDAEELLEEFNEAYVGCFESEEAFGASLETDFDKTVMHDVHEQYFWSGGSDGWVRDLFISDYWSERDGHGLHVFRRT